MRSAFPEHASRGRRDRTAGSVWGLAFSLALALGLVITSCSRQRRPGTPPKNLLLVTIDDLRPDHLSCYGYRRPTSALGPLHGGETEDSRVSLDALASTGVLFASAYAPSSSTLPSLASLFTGRGPLETGVMDDRSVLAADIPTLAELLGRAGFATGACLTLRRADSNASLKRGFESFETGASDEDTIRCAMQWMKRDFGNGRPFFLWLHLSGLVPSWKRIVLDPARGEDPSTGPFADPSYRGPADGSALYFEHIARREFTPAPRDVAHAIDLYDDGIVHVLGLVGEFLLQSFAYETSEVEATECWDRTLLVLTSPHGLELCEHGEVRPLPSLSEAVLQVPLVLRHPDSLTGERIFRGPIELQDVLPTVLDWFDVAVPGGVRGRSLLARTDSIAGRRFAPRPAFTSIGDSLFSVRTERWRLIWNPYAAAHEATAAHDASAQHTGVARHDPVASESSAMPGVSLFDHVSDRWELYDVAVENPGVVKDLQDQIRAWRRTQVEPVTRGRLANAQESARSDPKAGPREPALPPTSSAR